jgi:hypothetical protein
LRKFVVHIFAEPEENGVKRGFDPKLLDKVKFETDEDTNHVYVVPPETDSKPYLLDSKDDYSHFYIDKHNLVKTPEGKLSGNIVVYGLTKEPVSLRKWTNNERQTISCLLEEEIQEAENILFPENKIDIKEVEALEEVYIKTTYCKTETLKLKINDSEQEVELEFFVIDSDAQRIEASEIILRSHYLDIPKNGLFLGCRFKDKEIQETLLRDSSRNRADPWSEVWSEGPKDIVGCAVLSTLLHGVPRGRKEVARKLEREDMLEEIEKVIKGKKEKVIEWKKLTRAQIVEQLQIAWISRVAVDAPYRNLRSDSHPGLGPHIVRHLTEVALLHHVPSPKVVEVMRYKRADKAKELIAKAKEGKSVDDFLVEAGYTLVTDGELLNEYHPKKLLESDPITGDKKHLDVAQMLYYYKILDEK